MYNENGDYYLRVGLSAIQCIDEAVSKSKVNDIKQILDLPCGHGRVLRFISKRFPNAEITACDTNKDGVDFCEKEFGATPVYSKHDLKEFNIGKKFDLIWCGSLATHFDSKGTTELFDFFYRHLNSGGILIFSMHGKFTLESLSNRTKTYEISEESIKKVLSEMQESGYGYADYATSKGYGISLATPEWIQASLNSVGKWRDYQLFETAWIDHHDVYSIVKI